ncbi:hypothetical protein NHX12_023462 [Muraenolepis orangiensis]|uniref:Uncharacterized protein n=1 Tax=Muraenolepis orangiensis TaxID=630683 RepID=A0A9Q0IS53_9TELE|nr:hypothetical protein NHX12_023462 [Muraenolepis orangiensis]
MSSRLLNVLQTAQGLLNMNSWCGSQPTGAPVFRGERRTPGNERKKKPKEKHVAFLLEEEVTVVEEAVEEEAVASRQEAVASRQEAVLSRQEVVLAGAPAPVLRKRKRRGNKMGRETAAVGATEKVGHI